MFPVAPDKWFNEAIASNGGIFDRASFEMCMRHITDFRVAIDAGAHVGSWSIPLADRFEKVYAFEPNHTNFEYLKNNTKDKGIEIRNHALGEKQGKVNIRDGHENSGQSHIIPGDRITVRPLDECVEGIVDFIKIDTEGFELFVLRGASGIIEKYRPAIMVELNGLATRYGVEDREVQLHLETLGYRLAEVCNKDFLYIGK